MAGNASSWTVQRIRCLMSSAVDVPRAGRVGIPLTADIVSL